MTPVSIVTVLALVLAGVLGAGIGGKAGVGVGLGAMLGLSLSLVSWLWVRHALIHRPQQALRNQVLGFAIKGVGVFFGVLLFRFVDPLAAIASPMSFALSYVACCALMLFVGAVETQRFARGARRIHGAKTA